MMTSDPCKTMTFAPRFIVVGFYAASWAFLFALYAWGVPVPLLAVAVLIQLVNTISVALIPVRVCIEAGQVECRFPLLARSKCFDIAEMEWRAHLNPVRIGSVGDTLVLRSGDSKAVIWRLGVRDFDRICDALETAEA